MRDKWLICINLGIPGHQRTGDDFCKYYEVKLQTARAMAFITNLMYSFNWFLSFCALTWASAVILGALLDQLSKHDYFSVLALLLLEAVRLAAATFFGKFVTWKLVHGSADPHGLVYNDALRQKLLGIARIIEQAFQLTVLDISILIPLRRLEDLKIPTPSSETDRFDGLKTSLRIFYVLVLINAGIASIAVIFSKNVVPFFVNSFCLRKYYEKVVWKGMDGGLLHAEDFELLSWAFEMQADEYRRNTRAWVVKELYGDMMKYLYFHPRNKGFEAAKVALESHDTFEREAAANIVGLWAQLVATSTDKSALARLVMQKKLLAKLAEALDNDETGRAASVSFVSLLKGDPEGTLRVRSEGGNEMLADIFMDRIHEAVEVKKPTKALVSIKAMILLLPYLTNGHEPGKYCTQVKLEVLKEDLWKIVTEFASDLKRMQAVAAYAYSLLMTETDHKVTDLGYYLRLEPRQREPPTHILVDEAEYLYALLGVKDQFPIEWRDAVKLRAMEDDTRKPLPLLARRRTALVASFVIIVIIAICSYFIMRSAHF